jgi:tetratricopeptide (TPR) repeat protein
MSASLPARHSRKPARPAPGAASHSLPSMFSDGLKYHCAGDLGKAERLYRRVLAIDPDHGDCLHLFGLVLHQTGRLAQAADALRRATTVNTTAPLYHLSLANVLTAQGRPMDALASYHRVLELNPGHPEALGNLANLHAELGQLDEAIVCYRCILQIQPDYPGLHANLGNALKQKGRLDEAANCYQLALSSEPNSPEINNTLGNLYLQLGRPEDAAVCYHRALELNPKFPAAHNNLGTLLAELGNWNAAISCFHRALELKPDYPDALNGLGNAFKQQDRLDEAIRCYRAALAINPDYVEAHYNLANVLREEGQTRESVGSFRKAIGLRPNFIDAHINLGGTLADQRHLDEALVCYDNALILRPDLPDVHFNRALVLLARGDLAAGWPEYEWRWKMPQMIAAGPHFEQPQWRGEPAHGRTLLIHAEQGFGDTLQFCRYGQLAAGRGLRVIMSVPKPLVRLLRGMPGIESVVAEGEGLPAFDLHCPMLSLALALNTTLDTIPSQISYLCAEPAQVAAWGARLEERDSKKLRVGLVWAGSSRNSRALAEVDRRRSMTPDRLAPLFNVPGMEFFSLQKGGPAAPTIFKLNDFMDEMEDFADTAALIANLDLIISVDTAVAHLAAALGKRVWLLDRFDACWRWMTDRRDSPWYPTLRLYRQPCPGDWDNVIAEVVADLHRWVGGHGSCPI